jgi:leucyl aminopeptidase
LAAEDASNDSAVVSYGKNGDVEARFITVSLGATTTGGKDGKGKPATIAGVRKAVAAAVAKAKALKVKGTVEIEGVPAIEGQSAAVVADAVTQSAVAANYAFNRYINAADKAPHMLEALHITHAHGAEVDSAVAMSKALADGHVLARDCGSERADEMHPGRMEAVAKSIAEETGMQFFSVVGEDLLKNGMGMHYSVGQSAIPERAPRYVEMFHKGDPEHPDDVIAVVGKGKFN